MQKTGDIGDEKTTELVVKMQGIVKKFPGVIANDNVTFDLNPGEIHALMGENGSGKTTLMNVLSGLLIPDHGTIFIDGEKVHFRSPHDALQKGIGMVHQHFMLVPTLTVAENIILGLERPWKLYNAKAVEESLSALPEKFGLQIDLHAKVADLSVGEQQRVEIAKVLYRNARILILDEPTSMLTPQETQDLFKFVRLMVQSGLSVIFVTHKLDEVFAASDRISVMSKGRNVCTIQTCDAEENYLVKKIFGEANGRVLCNGNDSIRGS